MEETRQQQQDALLQVVRCFVGALSGGRGTAGEAMDAGGRWGGGRGGAGGHRAPTCGKGRGGIQPTPFPPPAPRADADEATALQDFMLAALRSFVRRYNVQCAQVGWAPQLAGCWPAGPGSA